MDEAGAAAVDAAAKEGHAEGFVVRDALEGANEVGALEILVCCVSIWYAWVRVMRGTEGYL